MQPAGEHAGIPEGVDAALLESLCEQLLQQPLGRVSYRRLSAWKTTGSYRVHLHGRDGGRTSVIAKEARYGADEIPALDGFPILPGAPEYAVCSAGARHPSPLLPGVYQAQELEPSLRYRYVFEDLVPEYSVADDVRGVAELAPRLPSIHASLAPLFETLDSSRLINYDADYRAGLFSYATDSLTAYDARFPNDAVRRVLDDMARLESGATSVLGGAADLIGPAHGDFNTSNVMIRESGRNDLKLIDWEWAGHGLPHADLASLVKSAAPEVQHAAVRAYAEQVPELTEERHMLLYQWCQLERGVLDASYLATQRRVLGESPSLDLAWCVENSAKIIAQLFETLR